MVAKWMKKNEVEFQLLLKLVHNDEGWQKMLSETLASWGLSRVLNGRKMSFRNSLARWMY